MKASERLARLVTKPDDLSNGIETMFNAMGQQMQNEGMPDDFQKFMDIFKVELNKILPQEHEKFLAIAVESIEQTYTLDQQKFLVKLYETEPWILEKSRASVGFMMVKNAEVAQKICQEVMEKIQPQLEDILDAVETIDDPADWWKDGKKLD